MKKFLIIFVTILLIGCTITQYSYYPKLLNSSINSDYKNYVNVTTYLVNPSEENSLIEDISVYNKKTSKNDVEILSPIIKILYNNKEYNVKMNSKKYKYTINLIEEGIKINGEFIVYIGKVKLGNGKTIDIPPLKFIKHIQKEEYNVINDALDKHEPRKEIFYGTVEDYKKQKK